MMKTTWLGVVMCVLVVSTVASDKPDNSGSNGDMVCNKCSTQSTGWDRIEECSDVDDSCGGKSDKSDNSDKSVAWNCMYRVRCRRDVIEINKGCANPSSCDNRIGNTNGDHCDDQVVNLPHIGTGQGQHPTCVYCCDDADNCDPMGNRTFTCDHWRAWSDWRACTKTCGGGEQTRIRECGGTNCIGDSFQTRPCNIEPCEGYTDVGECTDMDNCTLEAEGLDGHTYYKYYSCPQGKFRCEEIFYMIGHCDNNPFFDNTNYEALTATACDSHVGFGNFIVYLRGKESDSYPYITCTKRCLVALYNESDICHHMNLEYECTFVVVTIPVPTTCVISQFTALFDCGEKGPVMCAHPGCCDDNCIGVGPASPELPIPGDVLTKMELKETTKYFPGACQQ